MVSDNVLVPVPNVDRAKIDHPNLLAVVMEEKAEGPRHGVSSMIFSQIFCIAQEQLEIFRSSIKILSIFLPIQGRTTTGCKMVTLFDSYPYDGVSVGIWVIHTYIHTCLLVQV